MGVVPAVAVEPAGGQAGPEWDPARMYRDEPCVSFVGMQAELKQYPISLRVFSQVVWHVCLLQFTTWPSVARYSWTSLGAGWQAGCPRPPRTQGSGRGYQDGCGPFYTYSPNTRERRRSPFPARFKGWDDACPPTQGTAPGEESCR